MSSPQENTQDTCTPNTLKVEIKANASSPTFAKVLSGYDPKKCDRHSLYKKGNPLANLAEANGKFAKMAEVSINVTVSVDEFGSLRASCPNDSTNNKVTKEELQFTKDTGANNVVRVRQVQTIVRLYFVGFDVNTKIITVGAAMKVAHRFDGYYTHINIKPPVNPYGLKAIQCDVSQPGGWTNSTLHDTIPDMGNTSWDNDNPSNYVQFQFHVEGPWRLHPDGTCD